MNASPRPTLKIAGARPQASGDDGLLVVAKSS
jgi:hypothetical protein